MYLEFTDTIGQFTDDYVITGRPDSNLILNGTSAVFMGDAGCLAVMGNIPDIPAGGNSGVKRSIVLPKPSEHRRGLDNTEHNVLITFLMYYYNN